jgi:hypothetical protein
MIYLSAFLYQKHINEWLREPHFTLKGANSLQK